MGIEMSQSNQDPIGINWKEFDLDEVRESGWYAVHYGWNPEEGSWVKAINFDGGVFEESLPLLHISSRGSVVNAKLLNGVKRMISANEK
jgi:hypothetical protein